MITFDNIKEVINSLPPKTKNRIIKSYKEYTVIQLSIFNVGATATAILTDDYERYKNVSINGNAILPTEEVQEILNN